MKESSAELLYETKAVLGEGPVWDADLKQLIWVDIEQSRICRLDPRTKGNKVWTLDSWVGCALNTDRGNFLAGTQNGLELVEPETGETKLIGNPEPHVADNRFNDGKCDPQGRLWAGTMNVREKPNAGSLYWIDKTFQMHRVVDQVTVSNGLAWSSDNRTMFYIDSPTRRVDAFDFDPDQPAITNRRTIVEIPEGSGYPDGMTIDSDGMLWVALWEGWGVTRWNPQTGELMEKINLPVAKVTSCCFGGDDLDELYITTASRDLTEEDWEQQPLAGSLFVARPGVKGTVSVVFKE